MNDGNVALEMGQGGGVAHTTPPPPYGGYAFC